MVDALVDVILADENLHKLGVSFREVKTMVFWGGFQGRIPNLD